MNDRELLEMAAKAAGIAAQYSNNFGDFSVGMPYSDTEARWNPLTDDGDALRLAVKCGINVYVYPDEISAAPSRTGTVEKVAACQFETCRRAIVRAAAEIGKAMPWPTKKANPAQSAKLQCPTFPANSSASAPMANAAGIHTGRCRISSHPYSPVIGIPGDENPCPLCKLQGQEKAAKAPA